MSDELTVNVDGIFLASRLSTFAMSDHSAGPARYLVATHALAQRRVADQARFEMSFAPNCRGFELSLALVLSRPPG